MFHAPPPLPPRPIHEHHDQIFVPRPIVWMMLALGLFAIVSTGLARRAGVGVTREAAMASTRTIAFRTGRVVEGPIDARIAGGGTVRLAGAHEDIFPRLILQGIGNIRARDGADQDAPIELVIAPDGQRLLVDSATRRTVRLAAFGRENGASFDALLRGRT